LSTLALGGSSAPSRTGREGSRVRYVDLAILALALPLFVALDWPLVGYAVAAAAWFLQRAVLYLVERRVAASLAAGNRRGAMGLTGASALGRVWLLALAVLLVGLLGEDSDGLAAALLLVLLFTVQLGTGALQRLLAPEDAT
jgi:hypothetical protein